MPKPVHTQDAQCSVGPDNCCTVCGVEHSEPCYACGGRGFHQDACPEIDRGAAPAIAPLQIPKSELPAPAAVTEPLLRKLEAIIDECLAANVDADWILNAVESKIYGEVENA